MAGRIRHLKERNGSFYARLVVPKHLRASLGKTELLTPLGSDRRIAARRLPLEVALLQARVAEAQQAVDRTAGLSPRSSTTHSAAQLAALRYLEKTEYDRVMRITDFRYSQGYIDLSDVPGLRKAVAGMLSDEELADVAEWMVVQLRKKGLTSVVKGTSEWRDLAEALCAAELEALSRMVERHERQGEDPPQHPVIISGLKELHVEENATPPEQKISIKKLFKQYVAFKEAAGAAATVGKRYRPVIENLVKFLGHDDLRKITKKNIVDWRDSLLQTLSPKTVRDVYMAAVKAIFSWAVENEQLAVNPAAGLSVPTPRKSRGRERGFRDDEALAILAAARSYRPFSDAKGRVWEFAETSAAKTWVPLICAFTGARVTEITQARAEDFREEGASLILRITPEAGTVKTGNFRDVPIHPQLLELGLREFLRGKKGPLFYRLTPGRTPVTAARATSDTVGEWLRKQSLVPDGVAPNHGWRHRFKTQALELGISQRVMDAIQGHAGRTASDAYGDVTLKTKQGAIDQFPWYEI